MLKKLILILPFLIAPFVVGYDYQSPEFMRLSCILFMTAWMVIWWIFEILPLGITALIPMVFLPSVGAVPLKDVSPHYANPVIYLFLGGFMIARALEKTKLSERIAMIILSITGKSDRGILLGFIIATAGLSMWISNTATAVMMLPIAISVIRFLESHLGPSGKDSIKGLAIAIYLSIAYSANIGGIATPIGTPPNVVFVGFLDSLYQTKIDFWKWMLIMVPVMVVMLIAMYYWLVFQFQFNVSVGKDFNRYVKTKLSELGPVNRDQKITLFVFALTCSLWISKDLLASVFNFKSLNDTTIAIFGGLLLFLIPKDKQVNRVLDSSDINELPWNIVLLFGGGIALASALELAGVIQTMTSFFASFEMGSQFLLVLSLACLVLFLTEIMSNVALCVVALPVIMKLGEAQGIPPIIIALPAAICSSFAFMMPISTPPNAVVFSTNEVASKDMFNTGIALNIFGLISMMSIGWLLLNWLI